MSWQSLIICLSIITQSMGGGLGGLTPRKVRPLIWNMVGESFSLVVIATLTVHLFGFFLPTPPSFLPLFKFQMSCWTVLMLNISIQKDISEAQAFLLNRSLPWKWLTFPSLCWRDRGRLDHCFILNCHLILKIVKGQSRATKILILNFLRFWVFWVCGWPDCIMNFTFFTILLVCVCDHTFYFIWR